VTHHQARHGFRRSVGPKEIGSARDAVRIEVDDADGLRAHALILLRSYPDDIDANLVRRMVD
jgi:hypothetical protein